MEDDGVVSVHVAPDKLRVNHRVQQFDVFVLCKVLHILMQTLEHVVDHFLVLFHDISHFLELLNDGFLLFAWFSCQVVDEDLQDTRNLSKFLNCSHCLGILESEGNVFHSFKHDLNSFWCITV